MSGPAPRLLQLLSLLQRRPHWSGAELADRLSVTPRTVRRDVDRLRGLGYAVDSTTGSAGGYRLGIGVDMPPLLLDGEEALAVAVALGASTAQAAWGIEEAGLAALTKIERLLPAPLKARVDAVRASTDLVPMSGEALSLEVLTTLAQAIESDERVAVTYVDRAHRRTERRLEPHRLVVVNRRWYLLAMDLDRNDWRTLRLDRIERAAGTGHRFTPTPVEDAVTMVTEAITQAPYRFRATIWFDASPEELRRRVPPSVGAVEPHDAGCLLHVGSDHLGALTAHLLSLELPFEILEPTELRHHVTEVARSVLDAHGTEPRPRAPTRRR